MAVLCVWTAACVSLCVWASSHGTGRRLCNQREGGRRGGGWMLVSGFLCLPGAAEEQAVAPAGRGLVYKVLEKIAITPS